MEETIILTAFTDPMMGLSYESEPIMDALAERYAGRIEFRSVMSLLVRDVSDFMTPAELALPPEEGIRRYCARLAQIYQREESIGGLPIRMEGFRLFDASHRSSKPLCLAYHAVRLTAPERAETFLHKLRHATVYDCRPTTHAEELLAVARETGVAEAAFLRALQDGSAEAALQRDLALTQSMGVRSLPTYHIARGGRDVLLQSFALEDFVSVIEQL